MCTVWFSSIRTSLSRRLQPVLRGAPLAALALAAAVASGADDVPWIPGAAAPSIPARTQPLVPTIPLEPGKFTRAEFLGAASAAKEAMLVVQEPLSQADTARFEAKWAPLFDHPTTAAALYFNKLNPLLAEFLAVRGVIVQTAPAFEEAQAEAQQAAAYGNAEQARAALDLADQRQRVLAAAQARLSVLTQMIAALGNPPDPVAAKKRSRKRHDDAVKAVRDTFSTSATIYANWETPPAGWNEFLETDLRKHPSSEIVMADVQPESRRACLDLSDVTFVRKETDGPIDQYCRTSISKPGDLWPSENAVAVFLDEIVTNELNDTKRRYREGYVSHRVEPAAVGEWKGWQLELELRRGSGGRYYEERMVVSENGAPPWVQVRISMYLDLDNTIDANPEAFLQRWTAKRAFWRRQIHSVIANMVLERAAGPAESDRAWLESKGPAFLHFQICGSDTGEDSEAARTQEPTNADEKAAKLAKAQAELAQKIKQAKAEEKLKLERIAEHEAVIEIIRKNLSRDEEELGRTTDSTRREALAFRVRCGQSDIQAEQDYIATLRTGEIVHTRTPFEVYAHAQFVDTIRQQQHDLVSVLKAMEAARRLPALMPPGVERDQLEDFARRQMTPSLIAKLDAKSARQAVKAIADRVEGYHLSAAAKQDEKAAWADFGAEASQNIKTGADWGMTATSLFGGQAVNLLYQAGTGYVEGGPVEGIKRAATTYSNAIDYAVTFGEEYKKGGMATASQEVLLKYVQNKAQDWAVGKLTAGLHPGGDDRPRPTAKESIEAAKFKQERQWGEGLVKDFERAQAALQRAGSAGAEPGEIVRLQAATRDKAAAVASSLPAKNFLKYACPPATGRAYDTHMRAVHAEVDARVMAGMEKRKWNTAEWELQEFRNSASFGRPNMDRDVGLKEQSIWLLDDAHRQVVDTDGRPVPNPERWQTGADGKLVLKPQLTKNGKPASLVEWQLETQQVYNDAYKAVTKRSANMAMENVTTSIHPEAYKDLAWLGQDRSLVSAAWGAQAGDVTRYKLGAPDHADPGSSYFTRLQESARGTAKDMDTKLLPLLKEVKPRGATAEAKTRSAEATKAALEHWTEVHKVLQDFGTNRIDPLSAQRRLRELTGGKSMKETVDEMATLLESLVKFGGS